MNKKVTRILNFFFVIILFYALISNMHIKVYAASKGRYVFHESGIGLAPTLIYYYGDGKDDYVTYTWYDSYQGTQGYFTLSEKDKKKAPDAKTKGGNTVDAKNGVDVPEARKLSEESKKADEEKAQKKVDSGEEVETGFKYENGKLTYTYIDSNKKVHIVNYEEGPINKGDKTFNVDGNYTKEMKKAGVPESVTDTELYKKYGMVFNTDGSATKKKDSDDENLGEKIGDGILGILLLVPKLGILLIGAAIAFILSLFAGEGAHTLSVQDIIFNKVDITDINFFDIDGADGAIKTIRENVAGWYVGVRNIASVVLVIILIYVGIRMAISTVAEEKAKYKKMLIDWFTSMCLLFVLHYIILFTIQLNNTLVAAIGAATSDEGDIGKQFFDNAINNAYVTKGMANAICYLLLEAITFGFLIAYIKRMITIAFLIIIAPLVTITYSIDRMGDGKSQALNEWFKEFAYNILIQPFHCIAFLALCSSAVEEAGKGGLERATLAICLLAFLAKSAEDIVKRIFGFQAQSMASPAAAAVLGYSLAQNAAKFAQNAKKKKGDKSSDDTEEKDEAAGDAGEKTTRNSENNLQAANSALQDSANKENIPIIGPDGVLTNVQRDKPQKGQILNKNGMPISSKTDSKEKVKQGPQIKQRKLSGQGIRGKILRGAARTIVGANKYALTMGTGLALGAAQGDLSSAMAGTTLGFEVGQGLFPGKAREAISGSHYKTSAARAFNNYKAKTGMSDEEISARSMNLLKGNIDPENDDDKELKKAMVDLNNHYRKGGSSEKESYKQTNQVLKDIMSGAQGEETGVERLTGSIKEKYYKNQVKKYNKELMDPENNFTAKERKEIERQRDEAKQFVIDKQAREKFVKRNKEE